MRQWLSEGGDFLRLLKTQDSRFLLSSAARKQIPAKTPKNKNPQVSLAKWSQAGTTVSFGDFPIHPGCRLPCAWRWWDLLASRVGGWLGLSCSPSGRGGALAAGEDAAGIWELLCEAEATSLATDSLSRTSRRCFIGTNDLDGSPGNGTASLPGALSSASVGKPPSSHTEPALLPTPHPPPSADLSPLRSLGGPLGSAPSPPAGPTLCGSRAQGSRAGCIHPGLAESRVVPRGSQTSDFPPNPHKKAS